MTLPSLGMIVLASCFQPLWGLANAEQTLITRSNGPIQDFYYRNIKKENGVTKIFINLPLDIVNEAHQKSNLNIYQRIEECIKRVQPFLLGPDNEQLFVSFTKKDKNKKFRKITQFSSPFKLRPYHYITFDYGCPNLIHELFHYFGLEDEVRRKDSCNSLGSKSSFYVDEYLAFRASKIHLDLRDYYGFIRTSCVDSKLTLSESSKKHCDIYHKKFQSKIKSYQKSKTRPIYKKLPAKLEKEILVSFNSILVKDVKYRDSLLLPNQFRYLAYEDSENEGAALYKKCISSSHSDKPCPSLPKKCSTEEWLYDPKISIK